MGGLLLWKQFWCLLSDGSLSYGYSSHCKSGCGVYRSLSDPSGERYGEISCPSGIRLYEDAAARSLPHHE